MLAQGLTRGESRGGDGAPGFIRLETPDGNTDPGNTIPPAGPRNVSVLTDLDTVVGAQSLWYSTGLVTPPTFLRYEVDATIDGQQLLFSDDPNVSNLVADDPSGPLRVLFQAGRVDRTTRVADPGTLGPWRSHVGTRPGSPEALDVDRGNGLRFALIFNRSAASEIAVTRVSVFFSTMPTGVVAFGTSTLGCDGPLSIGADSEPTIGNSSFAITCRHAPGNAFGALVLSGDSLSSPTFFHGVEVWVDLTSPLLAAPLILSDGLGAARFPLPVPASPSLIGFRLFAQYAWPDACARGGVSASDALSMFVH